MKIQFLSWIFIGGLLTQGFTQTITVNVLDDETDGVCDAQHCSFREAITLLNKGEANAINFDPSLADTLWLEKALPDLTAGNCLIQGGGDRGVVISTKATVGHGWNISATRVTLKGLIFIGFEEFGMKLDSSAEFVFLLGNQFNYNGEAGLYVEGANNISIGQVGQPNWMIGNEKFGISLQDQHFSSSVTIEGNIIEDNAIGILGKGLSMGSYLGNNTIQNDSLIGISLIQSVGTRIFYNTVKGHPQQGILVEQSNNITIQQNFLEDNPIGIMQKNKGIGNRYTQNQFTCTVDPIILENIDQIPLAPYQICYDDRITGFANSFSRIEIYSIEKDSCSEKNGLTYIFLSEVQASEGGVWQYPLADSMVKAVAAIAIDALGNTSVFSEPISFRTYPKVILEVDSITCAGDSTTISAVIDGYLADQFDFFWSDSQGFEQRGLMVKELLSPGWYSFSVGNDFCYRVLDSVFVQQKGLDTIRIGESYGSLCFNTTIEIEGVLFTANHSRQTIIKRGMEGACDTVVEIDLDFQEAPIAFISPSICRSDTFKLGTELFYVGRERDTIIRSSVAQNGCDSLIIVEVHFIDHPVKKLQKDLCVGEFEIINGVVYDVNHPSGQHWIPGENLNCDTLVEVSFNFHGPQYNTIAGTYCEGSQFIVNGVIYDVNHPKGVEYMTNQYGCDSVIYIDLNFDFNTIYYLDTILCDKESLLINGNLYDSNRSSGVEQFVAGGEVNCDSIIYIEITHAERQGEVTLPPLLTVAQGGLLAVVPDIAFQPATISWSSNLDLSCMDCLTPFVLGDQSGWVRLNVTDANGCSYEANAQVELKGTERNLAFIPNAFSPNGDGINDVFEIFPDYNQVEEVGQLKIVDRWGKVVFHSDQPQWDGTVAGQGGVTGVYLYVVELKLKDGTVQNQNGSVFLYR